VAEENTKRKVLLIGWDAADWEHINPLLEEGLMPTLDALINRGVMGNLATLQPIAPTLLTLLNVPIGEDMDGRPLLEAFEVPPKIETTPSWEKRAGECGIIPKASRSVAFRRKNLRRDFLLTMKGLFCDSRKIMRTKRAHSRKSAVINNSRWVAYATAGAATALAGANSVEAAIHYMSVNQTFNAFPLGTQASNFQLDQAADFIRFSHAATAVNGQAFFGANGGLVTAAFRGFSNVLSTATLKYASNLASGQNIAAGPFVTGKGTLAFGALALLPSANSQFGTAGPNQFVGFRFNNGSGVEYGWARLTMDGAPQNSFTLVDYAWADVGTSITAGQVPEPGSLGLLALGGAGLLAWRKRRAKAAAQK
jgi:hypothetical protein